MQEAAPPQAQSAWAPELGPAPPAGRGGGADLTHEDCGPGAASAEGRAGGRGAPGGAGGGTSQHRGSNPSPKGYIGPVRSCSHLGPGRPAPSCVSPWNADVCPAPVCHCCASEVVWLTRSQLEGNSPPDEPTVSGPRSDDPDFRCTLDFGVEAGPLKTLRAVRMKCTYFVSKKGMNSGGPEVEYHGLGICVPQMWMWTPSRPRCCVRKGRSEADWVGSCPEGDAYPWKGLRERLSRLLRVGTQRTATRH